METGSLPPQPREESEYLSTVLNEPLHSGLLALALHEPSDPIDFLANYLRHWANHVRRFRREAIANTQVEKLLEEAIPWNLAQVAEEAKALEQKTLDVARFLAAERERLAEMERTRVATLTEQNGDKACGIIREDAVSTVLQAMVDSVTRAAIKRYEAAERERIKNERAMKRRRQEEEGLSEEGTEEKEEEEQEEEED